jgi:serine/threonine protein kinase
VTSSPPPQVAGFEVLAELGRGADSVVYRVRRAADGHEYALKVRRNAPTDGDVAATAFRREAALLAGVGHPDLTPIHEVGAVDGRRTWSWTWWQARNLPRSSRRGR